MLYNEYKIDQSNYREGILRIKKEFFYPRIEITGDPKYMLNESVYSSDLVFSAQGKLLEKSEKNDKGSHKFFFCYNEVGFLIRIIKVELQTNLLIGQTEFKYSSDGKMIAETRSRYSNLDIVQKGKQKHTYYENQKKISHKSSVENGEKFTYTFTYDDNGRVIEEKLEGSIFGLVYCKRSEYDDETNSVTTYEVNEEGKSAELSHIETYNQHDLITACNYPGKNNCLIKYQYKYDDRGNWIQMDTFEDDILQYHTIRKINYYPQTESGNR